MTIDNPVDIYLTCFEFTDRGMEVLTTQNIPFLEEYELSAIGNYYALVVGASADTGHGLLFGPLPVAYHHDQLVFIYGNQIKDERIKDDRVKKAGHMTPCFILIFFPVYHDGLLSSLRLSIKGIMDKWFINRLKAEDIDLGSLDDLKARLLDMLAKEFKKSEEMKIPESTKMILGKNIDFLDTVGNSLERPLRIGLFGSTPNVLTALQGAVKDNFSSLIGMNSSKDGNLVIYRFPDLYIESGFINPANQLDLKKTASLADFPNWKGFSKKFDGFLLAIQYPDSPDDIITKNIQTALKETGNRCPVSLLIRYGPSFDGDISSTPIPMAIAEATGRTISLVELKTDTEGIETAIIDLVENIVTSLQ